MRGKGRSKRYGRRRLCRVCYLKLTVSGDHICICLQKRDRGNSQGGDGMNEQKNTRTPG